MNNKTAVITGAGSGIGRETAILMGKEGARVVIADVKLAMSLYSWLQVRLLMLRDR